MSKLLILIWAIAALGAETYLVASAWPRAVSVVAVVFVAAALGAARDRRTVALWAGLSYVVPVLIALQNGRYSVTYSVVWLAALLGTTLPDAARSGWHIPATWRPPLACWAIGVCLTAPIVAMRAVDFRWELLLRGRQFTEALGGMPQTTVAWILHVALVLVIGVLWFDWLRGQDDAFVRRSVIAPLGAGVAVLSLVASYQLFVDVSFLNPTVYSYLKRASGTVFDANVAGALAACWIGGWSMWATRTRGEARLVTALLAVSMWLPVWATGSRTALALAALVTAISATAFIPLRLGRRRAAIALLVVGIVMVGTLAVLSRLPSAASGPLGRFSAMLPSRDRQGVALVARELWDRNGYGVAATRMIAEHPWFGIGVGSFHEMASEFVPNLPPDNAQNWYRHQLAELGVIGSLGWMVFLASFAFWIVRRPRDQQTTASRPLLGVLVGMSVVSLLGMSGQDPFVAITLWTFAAWYVGASGSPPAGRPASRTMWVAAFGIAILSAIGTAQLAFGPLRLPARIQRLGGEYLYGFYWPEDDGEGGTYRWARREATAVVPAPTRSLELTLRSNAPDLAEHPARVRAWVDGRLLIDDTLRAGSDSITKAAMLPAGERHVLVDTWSDRAVVAPLPDGRELAIMVRWRFLPSSR